MCGTDELTFERAHELLEYCPDTGVFTWKVGGSGFRADAIAGTKTSQGYWQLCIDRRAYRAHRVAWLLMTGAFPKEGEQIDHINRVRSDNRWANLRSVSPAGNAQNKGIMRNNASGYPGVHFCNTRKKWRSTLQMFGKRRCFGYFESAEIAHAVRVRNEEAERANRGHAQ